MQRFGQRFKDRKSRSIRRALVIAAAMTVTVTVVPTGGSAMALNNGTARTPPMGWNSWNTFGCSINESLIRGMADAIVNTGMKDRGYQYVVLDDCWFRSTRDSAGNLVGDPTRFPSGMKAMGDYIHSKGLKFGLYQAPLDKTCSQYFNSYPGTTGSQGHETQDAKQFAAWGVDYLKYDWCSPSGTINDQVTTFARMRDALAATGRPIVYSINSNSVHSKTGPQRNWSDVANMWRTTEDIQLQWNTDQTNGYPMGVQNIVNVNVPLASYAGPGGFNDPDMMEIGRGGLSDTEQRSHFALWAVMAAPLIAGNDIRNSSAATLAILNNADLIAVNQDSLGLQAVQVSNDGTRRVLAKRLANGDVAVALFNQGSGSTTVSTTAAAVGKSGSSFTLRDLWTGATSASTGSISANVPGHGTAVFRLSSSGTTTTTTTTTTSSATTTTSTSTTTTTTTKGSTSTTSTTSSGTTGTGPCSIAWDPAINSWPGGFVAQIKVTAPSNLSNYRVTVTLPAGATITNAWGATRSGDSGTVVLTPESWNASVSPGTSRNMGIQGTGSPTGISASCAAG